MRILWRMIAVLAATVSLQAKESLNFQSNPLSAGKASLTENGYRVVQLLGVGNFSPELRYPVQLVYDSNRESSSGLFGFGWHSPQLESSAVPRDGGALWTTPWGEKIQFMPKEKADKDTLELFRNQMKGRGFFAPYSDWEANTPAIREKIAETGDWVFTGKRGYEGWKFIYKDARLQRVEAPSGRAIAFHYSGDRLAKISQNGVAFVEIEHAGELATTFKINGIEQKLVYANGNVTILPKTVQGNFNVVSLPRLKSLQVAAENPVEFSYDAMGYLAGIRQGEFRETLTVQHATLEEYRANLAAAADRKQKPSEKVPGRLLADLNFDYAYPGVKPGKITLTNRLKESAKYDYDQTSGVFKVTEFSGKSYAIYYFMRYDVAYLGKVRQIVDGRGRTVVSYRYDRLTGNMLRMRDMLGNDINFEYDYAGNLELVTRRAAEQRTPEPVTRYVYDKSGNPTAVSQLNEKGAPVLTTRIQYNAESQPVQVGNGQTTTQIAYNRAGYPEAVRDSFGLATRMRYDNANRLTEVIDRYGVRTLYAYNAAGKVEKIERRGGEELLTSLTIRYNGNGLPEATLDQAGRITHVERDALGRVVREFFPDESCVEYAYNAVGRLHTVLDQNAHELKFDWSKFGLDAKTTAAGQLTDYVYDQYGLLSRIDSRQHEKTDRSIVYSYDQYDRVTKITYGGGEEESFSYDAWGKVVAATRGGRKAEMRYDYFGRLVEKQEGSLTTAYAYNPWGQRVSRTATVDGATLTEKRSYDKFGRLTEIDSDGKSVVYSYNHLNQLARQIIDNVPVDFTYTKYGQLESKILGGKHAAIANLEYRYGSDGTILGRSVDGKYQTYHYDKKGQLLAVRDDKNLPVEEYVYDPAGNILKKTVSGKTTVYTYDAANQLKTSVADGITTEYAYDAAGRLVKEGDKSYTYGWLDKILNVKENGTETGRFDYYVDGQLALAAHNGRMENFVWDGLALIKRGESTYVNEPYVTGGNPILNGDKVLFNDILGTTLGVKNGENFNAIARDSFGETSDRSHDNFFTGKPLIGEIGYAFLFRNYRANMGKWQTADPLGYPDGWNNFAYCNNNVLTRIDPEGLSWIDDIVSSIIASYSSQILQQAIAAAMGYTQPDIDVSLSVTGMDLSGMHISYDYEDAYSLYFVPLGSGTGSINPSSLIIPGTNYSNTFQRSDPEKYSVFDKTLFPSFSATDGFTASFSESRTINQRFGEWYNFSAITITNIRVWGTIKATSIEIIRQKYKEE